MSEDQLFSKITGTHTKDESCMVLPGEPLIDTQDSLELKKKKLELQLKHDFSSYIRDLVNAWILFIMLMVLFTATGWLRLSDTVLVSLIAGTSVNIIGLVVIVARHLFPNESKTKCKNYEE